MRINSRKDQRLLCTACRRRRAAHHRQDAGPRRDAQAPLACATMPDGAVVSIVTTVNCGPTALASLVSILPALPLQECWEALRRRVYTQQATESAAPAPGPGPGQTVALASPETPNGAGTRTVVRKHEVSQT